ncbi:imidazole glycerol phosphate synthase subunit HisH [Limnochorda pilosa]|uniref:Imidazole glycerol phosphate synthase subunit HisH n=1 Tax=Limnochorda pilosa TaxID=1555112 RepID=A0A0K2SNH4_LIMPI|nr:imidazole glycerol phosphate synthase subunit HisH [Limnochorda pilosa]BAS28650.1 imidazole glycerol phosphate synthase [Limnochorda pilosa]
MIGVVDYGMSNLGSVLRGLARAGAQAELVDRPGRGEDLERRYAALVLPGDGAFGEAMARLAEQGWVEALRAWVAADRPLLGICLGLQLLFDASEERFGREEPRGLGILPGRVVRFAPGLKVPQMGWNQVEPARLHPLWEGIPPGEFFYFVHSYYVRPDRAEDALARTEYGERFTSAAGRGRLAAVQFHPEKSGAAGLRLLANFVRWVETGAPAPVSSREALVNAPPPGSGAGSAGGDRPWN